MKAPFIAALLALTLAGCAPTRGEALTRVTFIESGRPTSVKVFSETPPGRGYGANARSMIFDLTWTEVSPGDYMVRIVFEGYGEYMLEIAEATEDDPVGTEAQ